jgi:hypothetical protein
MKFKFSLLFFMVFVLAISVNADTLTFNTLPSNQDNLTFNGFAGATLNGTTSISLICDDFINTTFPSTALDYNVTPLSGGLGNTRFGSPSSPYLVSNPLFDYEVAAVLLGGAEDYSAGALTGAVLAPTASGTPDGGIASYQYALWDLFEPGATNDDLNKNDSGVGNSAALLTIAEYDVTHDANLLGADFNGLTIYTPTPLTDTNQEFLSFTRNDNLHFTPTPEPSSYVFLGVSMLAMMLWSFRKRMSLKQLRISSYSKATKLLGMALMFVAFASFANANTTVPEIDSGSAGSALALLTGAVMVIRSRRTIKK